jgi:hypothetical protein
MERVNCSFVYTGEHPLKNWNTVLAKMAVFWVVAPCSLVEIYQRFRGPCCLHHQGDRSYEAARTPETLVNFYQTSRRYIPEDSHLHTHRRENLKSYSVYLLIPIHIKILKYSQELKKGNWKTPYSDLYNVAIKELSKSQRFNYLENRKQRNRKLNL